MKELISPKGYIQAKIKYKNSRIEILTFQNNVLDSGKSFLANCLLEKHVSPLFIKSMLFADGGTVNGVPKEVITSSTTVSGTVRLKKDVIAQIDPELPTQAIFSAVIGFDEGNDFTLNEMALLLSDGETIYSLSNFANLNKTDQMEIAWSWFVYFV
jgi:Phage tail-collar fibre protein